MRKKGKYRRISLIAVFLLIFIYWSCEAPPLPEDLEDVDTGTVSTDNDGDTGDNGGPATISITGINLDKSAIGLLNSGTYSLTASITPADCTETGITWSSDNTSIATVDASGFVTADAINTGSATITAKSSSNDTIFAECDITVTDTPIAVTGVTLDLAGLTLEEGEIAGLTPTIEPVIATDSSVSWSSSDESVATVYSGTVTAVSSGNTVITVTTNDGSFMETCNVTVIVPSYTLSFYRDASDDTPYELNYPEGESASIPGNQYGFTADGYTFTGWNSQANGSGTSYEDGDSLIMTNDTSLYAQWSPNAELNIIFSSPADELIDFSEEQDKFLLLGSNPELSLTVSGDFTAYSWYINSSISAETTATINLSTSDLANLGIGVHKITSVVLSDAVPYSKEFRFRITYNSAQPWLVTFDSQGGSDISSRYCMNDSLIAQPASPAYTGYTFTGWSLDAAGTEAWVFSSDTVVSDITLYAQWSPADFTIFYDANGGINPPDSQTEAYDSEAVLADSGSMTRTEAEFDHWNTRADGGGTTYTAGAAFTMPAENITLYAQWDITRYTVTYLGNGNTSGPVSSDVDYEYETAIVFPSAAEAGIAKTDYTLAGWNTSSDYSGTHYFIGESITAFSALTVFAEWLNEIAIVFYGPFDEVIDLTGMPSEHISIEAEDSLSISVSQSFLSYSWYINGTLIPEETSSAISFTAEEIESNGPGLYTFTVVTESEEGLPYSKEASIRVIY